MKRKFSGHYYEIQRRQQRKSWFVFLFLAGVYFFGVGLVLFALLLSLGFFLPGFGLTSSILNTLLWATAAASLLIAAFHYADARKNGARFIRSWLQAQAPDKFDRYHQRFINTVDEMRIAAGAPKVNTLIIPVTAVNSMALVEADNSPTILVTEGLLADFTRDEVQAVIAHELGHICRGDSFYLTLICSLANVFERIKQASEPDIPGPPSPHFQQTSEGGAPPLFYLAVILTTLMMHLFSTLVSREREFLADSAAVELNRNPAALAQAIYKAHVKNSFVGDFQLTYSPLFLVPPESRGNKDDFITRLFNSHPPLMKRIKALARMVPVSPAQIIRSVWESRRAKQASRIPLAGFQENSSVKPSSQSVPQKETDQIWMIRHPKDSWQGPFRLADLLAHPVFTSRIQVKNLQEDLACPAADFPQIRQGMLRMVQKKPINPQKHNLCPRCGTRLVDTYYEGVPMKVCAACGGKLIPAAVVSRILSRREVGFSENLKHKAREFKVKYMENPVGARKISAANEPAAYCPNCGSRMLPRPFTYHYLIPVDKCLNCGHTWFDADELEILQILIEALEDES
jgi:Zn-dependent protease with chaperone function/Zn-finger nucleic acid-binding protein